MKRRIYFIFAAVFLLGMVSGALLTVQLGIRQVATLSSTSTEALSAQLLDFLDRRLGLDEDQREEVAAVLDEAEREVAPLRRELRSRSRDILKTYRPRIAEVLDEDQRERFDRMMNRALGSWNVEEPLEERPVWE